MKLSFPSNWAKAAVIAWEISELLLQIKIVLDVSV
jgi:hypothetical protein